MFKKRLKKERFQMVYIQEDSSISATQIWIDTETGVNYLYRQDGYSGGLTPLLDAEGKPVVTPMEEG